MALFKKKPDPISDRARVLNAEIAALEAKIRKLDSQLQQDHSHPRLRSTAVPRAATFHRVAEPASAASAAPPAAVHDPIFEPVDRNRLTTGDQTTVAPEHYNELGVRKYDLPALWRRIRNQFHGPSTTNPKLVSYLAAGGIQGLRPMRYEKRVARNRFIALVLFLFLVLCGIIAVFLKHRG